MEWQNTVEHQQRNPQQRNGNPTRGNANERTNQNNQCNRTIANQMHQEGIINVPSNNKKSPHQFQHIEGEYHQPPNVVNMNTISSIQTNNPTTQTNVMRKPQQAGNRTTVRE